MLGLVGRPLAWGLWVGWCEGEGEVDGFSVSNL